MLKVDNAVILAAGAGGRFAPLSYEKHKALVEVKGDILIERQIRQLQEKGVNDIYIVIGFYSEQLTYLKEKFGVVLLMNEEYLSRNNHSSIWAARHVLGNSYICSVDNYFTANPFEIEVEEAYYAAQYAVGNTKEWCMEEDDNGFIKSVRIGGARAWYMMGHAFWSRDFSGRFLEILAREYDRPETTGKLWEQIFIEHLGELKMKIKKYPADAILEFDTLEELRNFDTSYQRDTRSVLIKRITKQLGGAEEHIIGISAIPGERAEAAGFTFQYRGKSYRFLYEIQKLQKLEGGSWHGVGENR